MKNYFDLTEDDFPIGEPVLKQKRGMWYRANNNGYTNHLAEAGIYERNEAIRYCFDKDGQNGDCGVLAVPVRFAVHGYSKKDLQKKIDNLIELQKYAEDCNESKVAVF